MLRKLSPLALLLALAAMMTGSLGREPSEVEAAPLRFVITTASTQPKPAVAGTTMIVNTSVQAKSAGTGTVSVVIKNSAGQTAWQTSWSNQTFTSGQIRSYSANWAIPSNQTAGAYTMTLRVIDAKNADVARAVTTNITLNAPGSGATATPAPPTATSVPPTVTPVPPTATSVPPTATSVPPTSTSVPPTATSVPPTATSVPPTATSVPPTVTATPSGSYTCTTHSQLDTEENALLCHINQYRVSQGLIALTLRNDLTAAAQWMSDDMVANNRFSHIDSLGRNPATRITAFGYSFDTNKGENLAAGYYSGYAVFEGWRTSTMGHNEIMLAPAYRSIGIGRTFGPNAPYGWYTTANFGGV